MVALNLADLLHSTVCFLYSVLLFLYSVLSTLFPLTPVEHYVNIGCCLLGSEGLKVLLYSKKPDPCYVCHKSVTNVVVNDC